MAEAKVAALAAGAYSGQELDLFRFAENWKAYWTASISPYVGRSVIEVGAGIGGSTIHLCQKRATQRWLCLEPDPAMAARLTTMVAAGELPSCCTVRCATMGEVAASETADTVLYIDVLEHIADDRGELAIAAQCIHGGGHLVVLSPAHQFLYSPFDSAIGHYRRYAMSHARTLTPPGMVLERVYYLDSVGLIVSLANRLVLRSAMPTARQIRLWDRALVPASKILDKLVRYRIGKSVVMVWTRNYQLAPVDGG